MDRRAQSVRAAGAAVIVFAIVHLCLNLYIVAVSLTTTPAETRGAISRLSAMVGMVAIPENVGLPVFFIKVLASVLFFALGCGLMSLRVWSRRPLLAMLALRIIYGVVICAYSGALHPHLALIVAEGAVYAYFLTRPGVVALLRR